VDILSGRLAMGRLPAAVGIVIVLAIAVNGVVRVSQAGWIESKGYLVNLVEERGVGIGLLWFLAATAITWAALVLVLRMSAVPAGGAGPPVPNALGNHEIDGPRPSIACQERHVGGEHEPSASFTDPALALPEWLEEKAADAPTMVRVVADILDVRLRRDYPRTRQYPEWRRFRQLAVVGGCVALALRLHVEVPQSFRTPLERAMRQSLDLGAPGSEALYVDCARFLGEALLGLERPSRAGASSALIATWVFGVLGNREPSQEDSELIDHLAQVFQNETSGYWVAAIND
jgi:hypothetical protein